MLTSMVAAAYPSSLFIQEYLSEEFELIFGLTFILELTGQVFSDINEDGIVPPDRFPWVLMSLMKVAQLVTAMVLIRAPFSMYAKAGAVLTYSCLCFYSHLTPRTSRNHIYHPIVCVISESFSALAKVINIVAVILSAHRHSTSMAVSMASLGLSVSALCMYSFWKYLPKQRGDSA